VNDAFFGGADNFGLCCLEGILRRLPVAISDGFLHLADRSAHARAPDLEAVRRLARREDVLIGMVIGKSRRGVDDVGFTPNNGP